MAEATLAPLAGTALMAAAPGGSLARAARLSRLPRSGERLDGLQANIESLAVRFDGRLRVTAVDRTRGQRVVFGSTRAPHATVAEAVAASCTVPWLFSPMEIGGREYVDGGVWSPTNLDAAPVVRDAEILCLHPTARFPAAQGSALAAVRTFSRPQVAMEALALRCRGAHVRVIGPNDPARDAMGDDFMAPARASRPDRGLRPGPRACGGRLAVSQPRRPRQFQPTAGAMVWRPDRYGAYSERCPGWRRSASRPIRVSVRRTGPRRFQRGWRARLGAYRGLWIGVAMRHLGRTAA